MKAGMKRWDYEYLTDPPAPYATGDISLRDSMIAFQECNRLGARVTAKGEQLQVTREVWLRNVENAIMTSALALSIASWFAYKEFAAASIERV
jgi:hypothetical protein